MPSLWKFLKPFPLLLLLLRGGPAGALTFVPTNYVATPGDGIAQGGLLNYFDDTGRQLIDGSYGANDWSANLGQGSAYEWVGWTGISPTMTFQFSGPVTIDQVGIDFNRAESDMIFLPSIVSIDGTDFAVAPDAIPEATRGTIFFEGNWTGTTLTINLTDCTPNQWTFVDEMVFNDVPVPEPSASVLMSLGLALLALRRSLGG